MRHLLTNDERSHFGKDHGLWKGDNASLGAIHTWIRKHYGKAIKCEVCKRENLKRYMWANTKNHKYSRNIEDYIQLCSKCHKLLDITDSFRDKISKYRKGKHMSLESRAKLSKAITGHLVSDETKLKISNTKKERFTKVRINQRKNNPKERGENLNYLVCTIKPWNVENFIDKCGDSPYWYLIQYKSDLDIETVNKLNPRYIFFPHWSWLIPEEIYEKYECVIFHMTDVPYGRGPEPLQHLISRGHAQTMLSALKAVKDIDAGPVYIQRPMGLDGNAEEIYARCSDMVFSMIEEIVSTEPTPIPQTGKLVAFKQRTIEDCRIPRYADLNKIYDCIRQQDAETYPPAFIETGHLRLEFSRASLKHNSVIATVKITKRRQHNR